MTDPQSHWNDLVTNYDPIMGSDPALRALRAAVVGAVPEDAGSILDLGCGTGALMQILHRRMPRPHLTGLDPAPEMLAVSRDALGDAQYLCASAEAIPCGDASFDAIVSCFALHHLTHSAKRTAASEMFRVLKPGGTIALGDHFFTRIGGPHDPQWVGEMFRHLCDKAEYFLANAGVERMLLQVELMPRFLKAEGEMPVPSAYWVDALEQAGFEAVSFDPVPPVQLMHGLLTARKP